MSKRSYEDITREYPDLRKKLAQFRKDNPSFTYGQFVEASERFRKELGMRSAFPEKRIKHRGKK